VHVTPPPVGVAVPAGSGCGLNSGSGSGINSGSGSGINSGLISGCLYGLAELWLDATRVAAAIPYRIGCHSHNTTGSGSGSGSGSGVGSGSGFNDSGVGSVYPIGAPVMHFSASGGCVGAIDTVFIARSAGNAEDQRGFIRDQCGNG
jgi:hypothetical protein